MNETIQAVKCCEPNCDSESFALGRCRKHYNRYHYREDQSRPRCTVEGCNLPQKTRTWCENHYSNWRNTGDPKGVAYKQPKPKPSREDLVASLNINSVAIIASALDVSDSTVRRWMGEYGIQLSKKSLPLCSCPHCDKQFEPSYEGQKFCTNLCFRSHKKEERLSRRPAKQVLRKMIESMTWCQIAKHFDVSDKTVARWAKSYGMYTQRKIRDQRIIKEETHELVASIS